MIGSTISHYRILEELGRGGMGVVYKAKDTRLDRLVALKFLPHNVRGAEDEKARFLQEARAASALNHPNICGIHAVGEHEGQQFIDMEFVDGMTMREKIGAGPLTPRDGIAYAIQIGEALLEAHSKGVVHRDVKAENIMINSKNQIKVMDFGLAKLKGSLKLTRSSSTIGTLAYMAPEQLQGGEADSRSDIFSLGVVLYEMLSGTTPFRGEHEAAMMYSILNEDPEPITNHLPDASPELIHVLNKALDKDPEDRYQSAAEMVVDLRRTRKDSSRISRQPAIPRQLPSDKDLSETGRISRSVRLRWAVLLGGLVVTIVSLLLLLQPFATPPADASRKRLVVLPFQNQGVAEKEYFADGITEEITSRLSGLSGLAVIARSSAMQYKQTTKTLKQIGDDLNVGYVLMGTVRWERAAGGEDRVRVSPELVKVSDATQIWSEPFEAPYAGSFQLQSRIASQVATALGITLLKPERTSLEGKLTEIPEAYDLFLQAKDYVTRGQAKSNFAVAEQMLGHAIKLDPGFAAAYAELSKVHSDMYWYHYDHTAQRVEQSRVAADRALALDPSLADGHRAMAWYAYHGKLDYEYALKNFHLALKRQPNSADALSGIGAVLRRQGRLDEAVGYFEKAVELDPRSPVQTFELGVTFSWIHRYPDAQAHLDRAMVLSPDWVEARVMSALNLLNWKADFTRCRAILTEALRAGVSDPGGSLDEMLAILDIFERQYERADQTLRRLGTIAADNQFDFVPTALYRARVQMLLGRTDKARMFFDSTLALIRPKIEEDPADPRFHSTAALAYAGLGRKNEAIRSAMHAVSLLPVSAEAMRGSMRVRDLAIVYTMVGEHQLAIKLLRQLLDSPSASSPILLRIDPIWDPLRGYPDFQRMATEGGTES